MGLDWVGMLYLAVPAAELSAILSAILCVFCLKSDLRVFLVLTS